MSTFFRVKPVLSNSILMQGLTKSTNTLSVDLIEDERMLLS